MRRLFEGGAYSSNYCNWQLKSLLQIVITFRTLLHLGQNVITFRTLLHLGPLITFRPSTWSIKSKAFLSSTNTSGHWHDLYPCLIIADQLSEWGLSQWLMNVISENQTANCIESHCFSYSFTGLGGYASQNFYREKGKQILGDNCFCPLCYLGPCRCNFSPFSYRGESAFINAVIYKAT